MEKISAETLKEKKGALALIGLLFVGCFLVWFYMWRDDTPKPPVGGQQTTEAPVPPPTPGKKGATPAGPPPPPTRTVGSGSS
jgi:hypothetical protein